MILSSLLNRFSPIALSAACVFSLAACNEHENPLAKLPAKEVAAWIYEHKTSDIVTCAKLEWSQSTNNTCQKTAKDLAVAMKAAGFGDVMSEDVLLGTIWTEFNERVRADKANHYSAEKTHKIFDSIKIKKPSEKGISP